MTTTSTATPSAHPATPWRLLGQINILLLLLANMWGCTATSQYMRPAAANQATVAPPDASLVVFLRPGGMARGKLFTVMDENGRFLGDAQAESRFAVAVPPGEHFFVTWSESAEGLRANLLPGRTYYVEVSPRMGVWTARVDLLAIASRLESWKELPKWLAETQLLEPDQARGQAELNSDPADVQANLKLAQKHFAELDKEQLAERSLLPEDGVANPGAPNVAPAAAPPAAQSPAAPPTAAAPPTQATVTPTPVQQSATSLPSATRPPATAAPTGSTK